MIRGAATREHTWWTNLGDAIDEATVPPDAPDPWGDRSRDSVTLSDDQRQFLVGEDQPAIGRVHAGPPGLSLEPHGAVTGNGTGGATGNPPGDARSPAPYGPEP